MGERWVSFSKLIMIQPCQAQIQTQIFSLTFQMLLQEEASGAEIKGKVSKVYVFSRFLDKCCNNATLALVGSRISHCNPKHSEASSGSGGKITTLLKLLQNTLAQNKTKTKDSPASRGTKFRGDKKHKAKRGIQRSSGVPALSNTHFNHRIRQQHVESLHSVILISITE